MHYVYILRSKKDGKWYAGSTNDLRKRFSEHNSGKVSSTKGRSPFELIYYEACHNEYDARMREKYLKSGNGKRYLKNRMRRFLSPSGFTIVELLIVLGITAILATIGVVGFSGFRHSQTLGFQVNEIISDLRWTASRALSQESGTAWGVYFVNPVGDDNDYYEIWSGISHGSGTIIGRTSLAPTLEFTTPQAGSSQSIGFSKSTGLPTAISTIVIYSNNNNKSGIINLNLHGVIDHVIN